MSIQPQFEGHRYVGEICRLQGQAIVECRLSGSEISSILAVNAKATPTECACADGEVRYAGKVVLSVVYEDGERKICRAERGIEFSHKAEGGAVTPACFAKVGYSTDNVTWRREGSGLYLSVVIGADVNVYGGKQMEYLTGGEGLLCKSGEMTLSKNICVSGETEGEDEFDSDYVGDVLLHGANAVVYHVAASAGQLEIEGETALHICVLKEDEGVCSYERLIPFRMQIPCEEAFGEVRAHARVCVKSAQLTATTDEENKRCRMVFSYCLAADAFLYTKETLTHVADAFSPTVEIALSKANEGGMYLTSCNRFSERIGGVASLSPAVEGDYSLQAALLPRVEISCRRGKDGYEAEGIIFAEVLLKGADGGYRSSTLSLPFLFPVEGEGALVEGAGIVCGLNVRRKKNGETEAEGTVKGCLRRYEQIEREYIRGVEEGAAYPEERAFSVFFTESGEELWDLSKRLHCSPENLQKDNPQLEFPLKKREKIFVYRQIQ